MKKILVAFLLSVSVSLFAENTISVAGAERLIRDYHNNYNFDYSINSVDYEEPDRITIVEAQDRSWAVVIESIHGGIKATRYVKPGYPMIGTPSCTAYELAHMGIIGLVKIYHVDLTQRSYVDYNPCKCQNCVRIAAN